MLMTFAIIFTTSYRRQSCTRFIVIAFILINPLELIDFSLVQTYISNTCPRDADYIGENFTHSFHVFQVDNYTATFKT